MTTALYRRYRPDTFEQVIGQEHVTKPLQAALRAHRVNHAYLFSGPRGCGKTTSARILARCLNCAEGPTDTPCGQCESCRELATGGPGSLDVVEIDAASHGGVDDARDLRERATFAPVRDRYKVFIIDEAHMVSPQGFNALLKLVEEPPEHVKFIFATTEPERVIGTIRSRTHHYPFRLVPPDILEPYLQTLCDEEHIRVGEGVLPLVIRAGGGSVRDSLSVLDQLMAGAIDGEIAYKTAVALLGYTDTALLDETVDALAGGDGSAAYRVIEKMVSSGHDPRRFVEDFLQRLRDLLIIAVAGDGANDVLVGTPHDQFERMSVQAKNWGTQALSRAADLTDEALRSMTGATSPRLQLELLIGRILVPGAGVDATAGAYGVAPAAVTGGMAGTPGPLSGGVGLVGGGAPAEAPAGSGSFGARQAREALARKKAQKSGDQDTSVAPEAFVDGRIDSPRQAERAPQPQPSSGGWEVARPAAHSDAPAQHSAPVDAPAAQTPRDAVHEVSEKASEQVPAPSHSSAPAPAPAQVSSSAAAPNADLVRQRWGDVVERLATHSRVVWSLLSQNGQLGAVDGDQLVILFPSQGMVASFTNGGRAQIVEDTIYDVLGVRLHVSAQVGQSGGGPAVSTPSANAHSVAAPVQSTPAQAAPVQSAAAQASAAQESVPSGPGNTDASAHEAAPTPEFHVPAEPIDSSKPYDPQAPESYDWHTQAPPPFDPGDQVEEVEQDLQEVPAPSPEPDDEPEDEPAATSGWSETVVQPPSFDPLEEESAPEVPNFAEVTPLPSQRFARIEEDDDAPSSEDTHSTDNARSDEEPEVSAEASAEEDSQEIPATPSVSAAEDDSASIDDQDMSESNLFGIPAVLDILGGTIIEQKTDDQGGW
ncbi:DNA polymerase III subunit gamma and tau [Trueperella pyogenes]|uniref:DNA polymerase III subunit gamma and tau n=1 Tax=Trueperella pyogenes TaxID=1661 RepID=UPI000660A865|nr:DNA polymerase III subunit gamma and tau [Trueperella pyogenes]